MKGVMRKMIKHQPKIERRPEPVMPRWSIVDCMRDFTVRTR